MAATQTVAQRLPLRNSEIESNPQTKKLNSPERIIPQHGVVTLFGYGISVRVNRGHLILEDGIADERREGRFPRVGHGLERLVVIGNDGMASLAALRWLADQNAAFVMLERDGSVLATTGPVRPSDAKLRRAQARADESGVALQIARGLIHHKLLGQEQVARDKLRDSAAADSIAEFREALRDAGTMDAVRLLESQAASVYWIAWQNVPVTFPRKDLPRVPDHWRTFGTRKSVLSGSPRLAVNPANATLSYLYSILSAEASLAIAAMGLDPGLGYLHVDNSYRDSLAWDLIEPSRPKVDAFVFDWISGKALKREWFFEQRNGNCRLMADFASILSETAPMWRRAVAPYAEWLAHTLWSTLPDSERKKPPATRLTQRRNREAQGGAGMPPAPAALKPQSFCKICGTSIRSDRKYCGSCAATFQSEQIREAARSAGTVAAHSASAKALRSQSTRSHAVARASWDPSSLPDWLTPEAFIQRVQPLLANVTTSAIATALGVSWVYASHIRAGTKRPHPRHWVKLAEMADVAGSSLGRTVPNPEIQTHNG
jgi:CRISPR-associated endonuclease Cas1